ncbi:MAG: hypothetical protein DRI92_06180 [Aquificota bacterium]|nr:MAG: hypothetical protein DRI92_06180 [Aquificota bacterium]
MEKPNLCITLQGPYRGYWKCWACGKWGKLTEVDLKKLGFVEVKQEVHESIDFVQLNKELQLNSYLSDNIDAIKLLSEKLQVSEHTLRDFGIGLKDKAYSFPCYDGQVSICGIQYRDIDGNKWAERGSKIGVFLPRFSSTTGDIFLPEGLSDTMILYDMGFNVIGRYNCDSCADIILEQLQSCDNKDRRLIVLADSDEAGINGAVKLRNILKAYGYVAGYLSAPSPFNDIREWVQREGKSRAKTVLEAIL